MDFPEAEQSCGWDSEDFSHSTEGPGMIGMGEEIGTKKLPSRKWSKKDLLLVKFVSSMQTCMSCYLEMRVSRKNMSYCRLEMNFRCNAELFCCCFPQTFEKGTNHNAFSWKLECISRSWYPKESTFKIGDVGRWNQNRKLGQDLK